MRIKLQCATCLQSNEPYSLPERNVPFVEEGIYRFDCPKGHSNAVVLQQLQFEVLAEVGLQAIVDGYYREAITSFNASLERFYEFYLRVVARRRENLTAFDSVWTLVKAQSERQLGMFYGIYAAEMGEAPVGLPRKCIEFRNKVVHQGLIPTEEQAINFSQSVTNIVSPILLVLHETYAEEVAKEYVERKVQCEAISKPGDNVSWLQLPMVYRLIPGSSGLIKRLNLKAMVHQRRRANPLREWIAIA